MDMITRTRECTCGLHAQPFYFFLIPKKDHQAQEGTVSCDMKQQGCNKQVTPTFGVSQPENSLESVLIPVDSPITLGTVSMCRMEWHGGDFDSVVLKRMESKCKHSHSW